MIYHRINCPTFGGPDVPNRFMIEFIDDENRNILALQHWLRKYEWERERNKGIKPLKGIEQRARFQNV